MSHRLRRGLVFLGFCLIVAAALPLLSRGDGPPLGEKYALLVGVRNYDKNELRNLPFAEADMTALAEVLKKAGFERVVLMTQTHGADEARFLPLAANIRTTLKGLLADRTADDSVLVAFAGHGLQYQGEDENYFCPMDAKLEDKTTLISLSEVYKDLKQSAAGARLLLADCCRNDPRSDDARAVDRIKLERVTRPQRALPPGGVAAFFSCSVGEKAYENAGLKHGVFFHFIIAGLQGQADLDKDGLIGLDELVAYTRKRVPDFVADTYGDNMRQMPELIGRTQGNMALVRLDGGGRPDPTADKAGTMPRMKMKLIKPGQFLMGSPEGEKGRYDENEGPQHKVEITKAFSMGAFPVTKAPFAAFVQDSGYRTDAERNGKGGWGYNAATRKDEGPDPKYTWKNTGWEQTSAHPVVNVSWNDAVKFCEWLSKKEAKTYELPTEAEWEYACRAGTTTPFHFGATISTDQVNHDNSRQRTTLVGSFLANVWGLFDMHGNVWEWCADWFGPYPERELIDPQGDDIGSARVLRGGSWYSDAEYCRAACRYGKASGAHNY